MTTTIGGSYPAVNSDSDATINGLTVGKGAGSIVSNTAVGSTALTGNTTGSSNTSVGRENMYSNTTGSLNTAVGNSAMFYNTTGASNTAVGSNALQANTTASNNTAVGYQACYAGNSPINNTALGYQALYNSATYNNVGVGYRAGYALTSGQANVVMGTNALSTATTSTQSVAIGQESLAATTTGANNTALGYQALVSNTTASNNTAVGYQAGYSCTVSPQNTFIGVRAGYSSNATASGNGYNTCVGYRAGFSLTTGYGNTFIGSNNGTGLGSGDLITTGNNNSILGAYNGNSGSLDIRTLSNNVVLSDGDGNVKTWYDSSGTMYLGCTSFQLANRGVAINNTGSAIFGDSQTGTGPQIYVTNVWSNVANGYRYFSFRVNTAGNEVGTISTNGTSTTSYNTSSDYRLKQDIQPMTGALARVALLKPVTYKWKADGSVGEGFIAHELQEVCPIAVTGEKDAVEEDGKPHYQGIDTSHLVGILTAAIQELKAEFDAYKATHP